MNNRFTRSAAAFAAAGLMMLGTAFPICAKDVSQNIQGFAEDFNGRSAQSVLRDWYNSSDSELVDPEDLEENEYYIIRDVVTDNIFFQMKNYKLIRIENIYDVEYLLITRSIWRKSAEVTDMATGKRMSFIITNHSFYKLRH
ncbi:MAG: hypothetical protein HUJ54_04875 [Erysipelotrichaceae bacterium]|nr:hypothetical protein [Erysipelotrichaceae bacterium]